MSFRNVQQNNDTAKTLVGQPNSVGIEWVRNPTWLPMPSITSSNEEVDMLVAIYPESNYIAFRFETSSGQYNVDWGDGTSTNYNTNVTAEKLYSWSSPAFNNTDGPVTFTDSDDTVNRTAHGYTDGMTVSFATIFTTTGITTGQVYYVVNATVNTFQVSATFGGSPISLTSDGSGTILPYKQAMVKVTPVSVGATLTTVNLQVKNTTANLQTYVQPILEATISANCSSLAIGGTTMPLRILEKCTILRHNTTSFSGMFQDCSSLQSLPLFDTASVTVFSSTFINCRALTSVPLFNTAAVTTMSSLFQGCTSLVSVPLFNTASVTNMNNMFNSCRLLTSVPLFNTAAVTTMNSMFASCSSLTSVPLFNTAAVTTMSSIFNGCGSLKAVPLLNTGLVTDFSSAFSSCSSLVTVPLFNTASATTLNATFASCTSLVSVPLFNTASVTNMIGMFNGCTLLRSVPLFNTAAVTAMSTMFNNCANLVSVPAFNTAAVTGTTAFTSMFNGCSSLPLIPDINFNRAAITTSASYNTMFNGCSSLSAINTTSGPKFTFTVANCKLSGTALDALYTSLPTVTSQTITVSGNVGTATDTPSIATAKGWTVTGS